MDASPRAPPSPRRSGGSPRSCSSRAPSRPHRAARATALTRAWRCPAARPPAIGCLSGRERCDGGPGCAAGGQRAAGARRAAFQRAGSSERRTRRERCGSTSVSVRWTAALNRSALSGRRGARCGPKDGREGVEVRGAGGRRRAARPHHPSGRRASLPVILISPR